VANLDRCNVYKNGVYKETYFHNGKETYHGVYSAVEVCFLAFLEHLEYEYPAPLWRLTLFSAACRVVDLRCLAQRR